MAKKSQIRVDLNLNIRGLTKSATLAINERCFQLKEEGRNIYKLGFGQSPFPVPEPVVESLRQNAHQKDYLPVAGLRSLREAIAHYWKRKHNLDFSPNEILVGPGSKELLFLLQLVYYGDLIIPTPSWVSYSPQALIVGRRVNWVKTHPENDWRLTPEELESICRTDPDRPRILILNYPANPTGVTYTIDKLKKIAEIARKYKVILLSDEIYGELHHKGQHVSVARFYPEGTIISSGLSKWCGAGGWRLGMFTFPSNLHWLKEAMSVVASETFTATSAPVQYAAVTAFEENEEIEAYLAGCRRILRYLGKLTYNRLREFNVFAPKPEGGFYLFPNFSNYRDGLRNHGIHTSEQLCSKILEDTGIALLPSYDFGRPSEELTARLSYVDFDGARALKLLEEYSGKNLDKQFIEQCFPKMREALNLLEEWLSRVRN